MGLKWLITGGCGFIGRNLVKHLLHQDPCLIRIVDNFTVGTRDDLARVCDFKEVDPSRMDAMAGQQAEADKTVQLIEGDILDPELAERVTRGFDVIVHLAANTGVGPSVENPRMDCETNVIGTLNYLEAARKNCINRFVFASSGAPAGEVEPPIHEELPPHPVSPYGASKLAGEGYCSAYFRTFNVETVCLRFGNVYGPYSGKKDSVVARFIKQALAGEPLEIYGDGSQTRDFIYIDDLIQAIQLAAEKKDVAGEIFQIATSRETTVNEITQLIVSELEKKQIKGIEVRFSQPRKGDVKRNFSDTRKAGKILGWYPQTDLSRGLRQTLDWFWKVEMQKGVD